MLKENAAQCMCPKSDTRDLSLASVHVGWGMYVFDPINGRFMWLIQI